MKVQRESDKHQQRTKDLSEKIKNLESTISDKDKELKQSFEEQRKIHELLRNEKDRVMNAQIQCKSIKM